MKVSENQNRFNLGSAFGFFAGAAANAAAGLAAGATKVFTALEKRETMRQIFDQLDSLADGSTALFYKSGEHILAEDTYLNRAYYWASGYSRNTGLGAAAFSESISKDLKGISPVDFITYIQLKELDSNKDLLRDRMIVRFSELA